MSLHRHCDWCKKDCGHHAKVSVDGDQYHFCTYACAAKWFEKQEVVYEVVDSERKHSYWANADRMKLQARRELAAS